MKRMESGTGSAVRRVAWTAGFAASAVLMAVGALADEGSGARAARLSSVDGQVRIARGGEVVADQAVANAPLFEGSQVTTGEEGRAEIQFEDGSVARISPNSSLTLSTLRGQGTGGDAEVVLESGLGYFELLGGGQAGAIRIRFGESVVTASGFTVLRIKLDNPPGELAVFSGNAHLEQGSALMLDLHGGESVALNAAEASRYKLAEAIEPDSWDAWNADRDQVLTTEAAARTGATKSFVNSSNPAWGDLDANGNWYNVPGQGYVWSPYDASNPGWDPYGNGYWMPGLGSNYMWVSGYPWGYLPYQCGMWNWYGSFGWGWAPGMGGIGGMGGCFSGWGSGLYLPNIGSGYGGYLPPTPPRWPRRNPIIPVGGHGHRPGQLPVIAVNRPRLTANYARLPARDGATPVVIAGHTVMPLRSLQQVPRTGYNRASTSFGNGMGQMGFAGLNGAGASANRPTFTPQMRSSRSQPGSLGGRGGYPAGGQQAPAFRGGSGGYQGGGAGRAGGGFSGGAPASRPSGGGFSGGGAAPRGGGFSGGGGAPSGGGGSHGGGGAPSGGGGSAHH